MRLTEEQVIAGLTKRGVPTHVAQGVTMNFRDESGLDTGIQEGAPNVHGTRGFGIAQWTDTPSGKRRTDLANYAAAQGKPMDDPEVQLDFFMHENAGAEAKAWSIISSASTKEEAAVAFVKHWERPAPEHVASRSAKYMAGGADFSTAAIEVPANPDKPVQMPDAPEVSIWQLTKDAAATQQTAPWLYQQFTEATPEADPNWALTTERMKADFEARGLPVEEKYMEMVEGTVSEADYINRLGEAQVNNDRLNRLASSGWTGASLQIANQILDPVALAADIAASSVAPQLVLANRGRRIHRVLAASLAGGAGALASEGVAAAVNPNRQASDMFYGTVLGIGVGGVVGSMMKGPATVAEGAMLQRAAQNEVRRYEDGVSGVALNSGSVGAARVHANDQFLKDDAFEYLDIRDMPETAFGKGRASLSAYLNTSPNVVDRSLAGLVQDGVGKKGGAINHIAASEDKDRLVNEFSARLGRVVQPQLKAFRQETGLKGARAEYEFGAAVQKYMFDRRHDRTDFYPKSVSSVGNKLKELYSEVQDLQKNPFARDGLNGRPVAGALDITDTADWSGPRYWDPRRMILANADYAKGEIERLFEGAIRSAQPDLDEAFLKRLAGGMARAITARAHGLDAMARGNVGLEDMEELAQTLMNHGGLSRADADALLHSFKAPGSDAGRDASMRRRVLLDENYRLEGLDGPRKVDGTVDELGLGIMDLMQQDAIANFHRYIRPSLGRVALARYRSKDTVSGDLVINGITGDGEFRKLLDKSAQKNADLIREGKITEAEGKMALKRLEFAYNSIMGRPLNDMENTEFGFWARLIRKFNFARLMNQVGFAQIAEVGMPPAHLGVKAAFSQIPAMRRIVSLDGETMLKSGLADDIELWSGLGADRLVAGAEYRFDDLTGIHDAPTGTWRDKAEHALNVAGRVTSEASGLMQANVMLNRWTAASIIQKFADMAHGSKGLTKARLADLGLDEDMTSRILAQFKEPGNFEYTKGLLTNRKVTRAHFAKWSDKEAAEAFRQATYRLATTIIQKNDIGNMMMWMSRPSAKMLMQFRTFMVGAYEKQTLKSAHMRDGTALKALAFSMGFAAVSYAVQTKLAAATRADKEEYLEDRLSMDKLGYAAFARAGASSIIPMLVDTGAYLVGSQPFFSHARTTGQVSNMILGNPTTGGIDDLAEAFHGLGRLAEDREWSQQEARALFRVLPFGNAIPITAGLNVMIADLPEFAPKGWY